MQRETELILNQVQRSNGIVADGDRTLWKSNAAEKGIGVSYIREALFTLHLRRALNGVMGYREVKKVAKQTNSDKDSAEGLKFFYDKLIENGIGSKSEMEAFALSYIGGHTVRVSSEVLALNRRSTSVRPAFLATMNGSSIASAAKSIFSLTDTVSNMDLFGASGKLVGVDLIIKSGEDKVRLVHDMLAPRGIRLKNCVVIGDSKADIPMLSSARFSVASPFATEEVKRIATYCIKDKSLVALPHLRGAK